MRGCPHRDKRQLYPRITRVVWRIVAYGDGATKAQRDERNDDLM